MLYLKSCPKCNGDVHLDSDRFGTYAKCLQCGFSRDFPPNWSPSARPEETSPATGQEEQAA